MTARDAAERVWKALADEKRRRVLDLLAEEPLTTGQICAHFAHSARPARAGSDDPEPADPEPARGIGRTGVMKHLDVLRDAGLITIRREGRLRWNHLNPVPIQNICDRWVSRHVRGLARSATRLKQLAERRHRPGD